MGNNFQELRDFLKQYPNPIVSTPVTIKSGGVVCIRPIPTICGAEVYCNTDVLSKVREIIRSNPCTKNK